MRVVPTLVGRILGVVVLSAACAGPQADADPTEAPPQKTKPAAGQTLRGLALPEKVHADAEKLHRSLLAAIDALIRDDPLELRAALDRAEEACRRVMPEEERRFGGKIPQLDAAMHQPLTAAREQVLLDDMPEVLNSIAWVMRGCEVCHEEARTQGLMPAEGPLWERSAAEAP